ncbi:MAG: DUF4906 domain-containing protein [Odoribacteraceae bacterium]|nr:DUF4906 domain-containing protein [Odoribacteraceae bacterium]
MKQTRKLFPLAVLALFAGACVVNVEDEGEPAPVAGDDGRTVTLSITVPGPAASRAMPTTVEDSVETIDVLLFDAATDKFRYRAIGTKPDATRSFSVRLPTGNWTVVLLANARAELANAGIAPATLHDPGTKSREEVLESIVMTLAPLAGWSDAKVFPMWGYYKKSAGGATTLNVDEYTSTIDDAINLTRAVARVDISMSAAAELVFSLESARLYNRSNKGSIAPLAGPIAANDGYIVAQWSGGKAAGPHVPAASTEEGPVVYNINNSINPAGVDVYSYAREIYTFEAAKGLANTTANTCLVIGGYYNGSASPTYYRVEFIDKDDNYLALLRNYSYNVKIQAVNGHGWPSADEAYRNNPANIIVNIVPWDEGGMNDVKFNDQHYLAVDKSELVFYSAASDKSLVAITDLPAGWTVDKTKFPAWLSIVAPVPDGNIARGAANVPTTLALHAADVVSGPRTHEFYIVANNLEKMITVKQLDEEEFSLEVDPWELTFYKTPQQPKTIALSSIPAVDGSMYTFGLDVKGNIAWTAGIAPNIIGNTVTLKPGVNDGGATRGSTVLVTLAGPDGKTVTRPVNVRQLGREMNFKATPVNPYAAAGVTDQTFPVSSEATWKLATAESDLALEDKPGWYAATSTDYLYHFSLAANPGYTLRNITVNVTSSHSDFAPRDFKISQEAVGPYITITEPSSPYNFGESGMAIEVKFTTNATWTFATDATYANVIANASGATAGTPYPIAGVAPTAPKDGSVTFTPSTGALMAGTKSTKVTFNTNPAGSPREIIFNRVVPVDFTFLGYSWDGSSAPTLPPGTPLAVAKAGGSVWIHAATNVNWYGTIDALVTNTPAVTVPATNSTREMVVPLLDVEEALSWTGDTDTQVWYGHKLDKITGDPDPDPGDYFNVRQQKYALTVGSSNPTYTSVSLNVQTDAPWFELTLNSDSDGHEVGHLYEDEEGTYPVDLETNSTGAARPINILNKYTGEVKHTFSQPYFMAPVYIDLENKGCVGGYVQGKTYVGQQIWAGPYNDAPQKDGGMNVRTTEGAFFIGIKDGHVSARGGTSSDPSRVDLCVKQ